MTKRFGSIIANDRVSLDFRAGEIQGLVGENGAGKSTAMSVAAGLYHPDGGDLIVDGCTVQFRSPLDAGAAGIQMVYQDFMLVPALTVAENIVLGTRLEGGVLNRTRVAARIAALSEQYGIAVEPFAVVGPLSLAEKQRVELLAVLYRDCRVLILDEPTSVLGPTQIDSLFGTVRRLAAEGKAIVFISHKLDEVLALCDRITVMRSGRVVASVSRSEANGSILAKHIVGGELATPVFRTRQAAEEAALEVARLSVRGDRGEDAVRDVSLAVPKGEIIGIAGVAGNGQRELMECLAGVRRPDAGHVHLDGREIAGAVYNGDIGFVPDDPRHSCLIPEFSLTWNVGLRFFRTASRSRWRIDSKALRRIAEDLIQKYDIRGADPDTPVAHLSGGNRQKLVLARELASEPALVLMVEPTAGLDLVAAAFVHERIADVRDRGAVGIIVSSDLDELRAVCDRIAVMYRGSLVRVLKCDEADAHTLGLLMTGISSHGEHGRPHDL
ncbi:MAG: ABC transporter ATP-binding protein [Actinomycetota bacterium]